MTIRKTAHTPIIRPLAPKRSPHRNGSTPLHFRCHISDILYHNPKSAAHNPLSHSTPVIIAKDLLQPRIKTRPCSKNIWRRYDAQTFASWVHSVDTALSQNGHEAMLIRLCPDYSILPEGKGFGTLTTHSDGLNWNQGDTAQESALGSPTHYHCHRFPALGNLLYFPF